MSAGSNPYRILIGGTARRRFAKLNKTEQRRIDARILALADNPRPRGVEKLTDAGGLHRIRVGGFRVLYTIDDEERVVKVENLDGRDDAYRKRKK